MGFLDRMEAYYREKYQAEYPTGAGQGARPLQDNREYLHSVQAGAWLPLMQSAALGIGWGIFVALIAALAGFSKPWGWGLGTWALIQALALSLLLWRWLRLTKPVEQLTGLDLDGDGYVGPAPTVRVQVTSEDRRTQQFADIPTTQAKMVDFARGVLAGQPISERQWSGAGALFSQNEFRGVRDVLLARGWLRWVNPEYPQQGMELAPAGRAVLRAFVNLQSTPTPIDGQAHVNTR